MSTDSGGASELQRALTQSIREHWGLFLIEGIVLVVLGLLAIIIPPIATIAVTIFLGWLFLISGIVGLIDCRRHRLVRLARAWRRFAHIAPDRVLHH